MNNHSEIALPRADTAHSPEATAFLVSVYAWMFAGLSVTTAAAWTVMGSPAIIGALFRNQVLLFGLLIGEVVLVMVISAAINRISAGTATALFLLYSAVNGVTLPVILLAYTGASVLQAFLSAACLFASMSIYGYATKRDLSAWRSLLTVALIALIVTSIINLFLGSNRLDFIISLAGVVVFLGLTAYDTQKILRLGTRTEGMDASVMRKSTIIGALALYLDFINLFLFLLRIMGRRK